MSDISKKDIRLINKVYQHRKRFMLRWPLSESDISRFNYDINQLNNAIDRGILSVIKTQVFPNVHVDVLRVSEEYEKHVSQNTKYFVAQKKEERESRSLKEQRAGYVDHYKHERDPFEGWKLTNGGGKYICTKCMALNKPCEHGKEFIKKLPPEARVPKANASKTRWKQFRELFLKN